MKLHDLTLIAVLAALICIIAPFALPLGPVPITLATFAIYLISAIAPAKYAVSAVALYILLGAIGLPVFSGFAGGFQRIIGATGGYIIGYLPCALIISIAATRYRRVLAVIPAMISGTVVLYALGTAWYMYLAQVPLGAAVTLCVVPFIPGDIIKIIAATLLATRISKSIKLTAIFKKRQNKKVPDGKEKKQEE